jgi:hypothetical protein
VVGDGEDDRHVLPPHRPGVSAIAARWGAGLVKPLAPGCCDAAWSRRCEVGSERHGFPVHREFA